MNTKERLRQLIDLKRFSEREFSKKIGASPTYFTTTKSVGSDFLEKIAETFPELNMDWVITGRGEMIFKGVEDYKRLYAAEPEGEFNKPETSISFLKSQIADKEKIILLLQEKIEILANKK